jgi:hypothetical protein
MALQFGTTVRNNMLDNIETTISGSPLLLIMSSTLEATCATANNGTILAIINTPSDWLTNASSGSKSLSGTWTTTAITGGVAGHFRIKDSGSTCHMQGTVTYSGSGGDMTLDNTNIATGQTVTINTFTLTAPGA